VFQTVQQQFQGEVIERACSSGDRQPTVADVEVVEQEGAYLGAPGGMNRDQGDDQSRGGGGGGRDGVVGPGRRARLERAVLVLADLAPATGTRPLVAGCQHLPRRRVGSGLGVAP
jgi:hypothetical protein